MSGPILTEIAYILFHTSKQEGECNEPKLLEKNHVIRLN